MTSSNGSSSQGYASANASPVVSPGVEVTTPDENDSIIAKVQFAGKDELLYKKVRVSLVNLSNIYRTSLPLMTFYL